MFCLQLYFTLLAVLYNASQTKNADVLALHKFELDFTKMLNYEVNNL